ncbi:MAG TPA: helix-turn-helix transcriptional regulator [Terriglobales bacterium]|nr:helix-turn-helix transcriptional regulator [Terriglobales bacterium]
MNGTHLKGCRKARGWTQAEVSRRLKVTQAYVSMLEQGKRSLPPRLARRAVRLLRLPATTLPLPEATPSKKFSQQFFAEQLGALGYPGYAYLRHIKVQLNPAQLLVAMLMCDRVESRLVEALPWLPYRYAAMDWEWVVRQAKLHDVQNRLGFIVELGRDLAERRSLPQAVALAQVAEALQDSRLAKEGTLCHEGMTQVERRWLRENRQPEARKWNLLTDLKLEYLVHAD